MAQEISVNDIVKVKQDKAAEFDKLFSGKPCMRASLAFSVVAIPEEGTITVKSSLADTFESDHIKKAHTFEADSNLFEVANSPASYL